MKTRQINLTIEEKSQRARLNDLYQVGQTPLMLSIERSVCGCDYGATSWTTRAEVEQMISLLQLGQHAVLLDLGSGAGWPALYLSKLTGCDVVLVDLPIEGLHIARKRALQDNDPGSCWVAVADAAELPFAAASFDALCHSDLLCCLERKSNVLSDCRRVLRPGGRMVFSVISVVPDLTPADHQRAVDSGPEFIESTASYPTLLAEAGWTVIEQRDVSAEFTVLTRQRLNAEVQQRSELTAELGVTEAEEHRTRCRARLLALSDGLLKRELFIVSHDQ
tara:strand:- start:3404 stop:4237 length:834 start_codon:yes stop_codon:yes gene_type:complete